MLNCSAGMLKALEQSLEDCSLPNEKGIDNPDLDTKQVLQVIDAIAQIFEIIKIPSAARDLVNQVLFYSFFLLEEGKRLNSNDNNDPSLFFRWSLRYIEI